MLRIEGLEAGYGRAQVLHDVSLEVPMGALTTVLGPNGAGKSTLLRAISGAIKVRAGRIEFKGAQLNGLQPHEIVRHGVAHVPEGRQIFPDLTVQENLRLGTIAAKLPSSRPEVEAFIYDTFPRVKERLHQPAGTMSGGEQQMLAFSRALMADPQVLLLDEPSMGLAPILVEQMLEVVRKLVKERNLTVLLVEQNTRLAMNLADSVYVLENGAIAFSGSREQAQASSVIQDLYLGGSGHAQ
ncbi:MAG: ABC transporter ATP-binding protein [Ottowia sp.]|uniref:ABC transporter ATP-binding protein n=1 Tax=Ottowia sp. TaxID=1898956 RepID=UPI0039E3B199